MGVAECALIQSTGRPELLDSASASSCTGVSGGSRPPSPAARFLGAGGRSGSHESSAVLWGARHSAAGTLGYHSETARQYRPSSDPVASHALLRALRPYGVHPVSRLP